LPLLKFQPSYLKNQILHFYYNVKLISSYLNIINNNNNNKKRNLMRNVVQEGRNMLENTEGNGS